jgi:hypothetical protein
MAVLIEAISVVMKIDALYEAFGGDLEAFKEDVPNMTLCMDSDLARVGFMNPIDVESYIRALEQRGMVYLDEGMARDIIVIDQHQGILARCDWVEFGHIDWQGDAKKPVAAARLLGTDQHQLFTPDDWTYERSLTRSFVFVPAGQEEKSLRFLRHEDNLDVYLNLVTGKEVYSGRTGER